MLNDRTRLLIYGRDCPIQILSQSFLSYSEKLIKFVIVEVAPRSLLLGPIRCPGTTKTNGSRLVAVAED